MTDERHLNNLFNIEGIIDLHKLRIFVTVARVASFTRAAERIHMTQPTVSQQIAILEQSIGTQLIERDTRHLSLTPAGHVLLKHAEQILAMASQAVEETRSAAGLADRTLRIGVGHTLATYLLPDLLRRYRSLHSGYHTRITVGNTAELLTLVAHGDIDVALVGSPAEHPELETQPFMEDRLLVIVAPDDPWAGRAYIEPFELRKRTLLTREPGSALHASVARILGTDVLASESVIVLGETEAIKRSVEAGLGVALIQGLAVEREIEAKRLAALPLSGADDRRTYLYAYRRRAEHTAAAASLIELLKAHPFKPAL
jgi:DNA-binding transcriptional LysR family regulator